MSRFFAFLALLSVICLNARTQAPATKTKPATGNLNPNIARPYTDPVDTAIENRLVALALSGPEFNLSIHQNKITELDLKRAKNSWLNLLTISTTYNDQTFKQPAAAAGQPTYVYPKYYFGVTIPLGIIFSQGNQVKAAREAVALSKDQQEILTRTIRDNVLSKYKQYKLYSSLLEMQSELINDVLANSSQAEESFKKGAINVDTYIAAQKVKNEELAKNMNLQLQQDLIRLDIEKMIGIPLEEVLHAAPPAPLRNSR